MGNEIIIDSGIREMLIRKEQAKSLLRLNKDIKEKNEIIREDMHNAYDENAENFYIICDYKNENKTLNLSIKHDGNPFYTLDEIIDSLFAVGKSNKQEGISIGNKGVGNKLNLSADKIVIESVMDKEKIIVNIINVLNQLESIASGEKENIEFEYKIIEKASIEKKGVSINLFGVDVINLLTFAHNALVQYIKYFTILGPTGVGKRDFNVYLKGLEFVEKRINNDININAIDEDSIINNNNIVNLNDIKTKENFEKISAGDSHRLLMDIINKNNLFFYNDEGIGFENNIGELKRIKELCNSSGFHIKFSILQTTEPKIKEQINPLIKINSIISINQSEFFGIYPVFNNIVIPTKIKNLNFAGGGNASVQYLGFMHCDKLYVRTDRNDIGGTKENKQFYAIVYRIIEIISKIVEKKKKNLRNNEEKKQEKYNSNKNITEFKNFIYKEKNNKDNNEDASKSKHEKIEMESEKKKNIIAYLNKKKIVIEQGGIKSLIAEPSYEYGVYGLFRLMNSINPEGLKFIDISINPYKGIDMLCCPHNISWNLDLSLKDIYDSSFWVEIKHILGNKINHNFQDISKILCWEIDRNLRLGKASKITDSKGIEYQFLKNGDQYVLKSSENKSEVIEIIELKSVFEVYFNQIFK